MHGGVEACKLHSVQLLKLGGKEIQFVHTGGPYQILRQFQRPALRGRNAVNEKILRVVGADVDFFHGGLHLFSGGRQGKPVAVRPAGLRFGAVVNQDRKYFVHGFPPFRRLDSRGRLRLFFFGPGGLLGQLGGLTGRFPLDGVTGEQKAIHLEIVGVLLEDGRGDFRKQMLVGLDTAIQIFVQCFPAVKDFLLPGDSGLSVIPRRIGVKIPVQRP